MQARESRSVQESSDPWSWQDNNLINAASGNPSFFFAAHFNLSCGGTPYTCSVNTFLVNRRANIGVSGATLQSLQENFSSNCSSTQGSWTGGSPGGWSATAETTDYFNITCTQGSTHVWSRGSWGYNGSNFTGYFNNKTGYDTPNWVSY